MNTSLPAAAEISLTRPRLLNSRTASRAQRNWPVRLTLITLFHCSKLISWSSLPPQSTARRKNERLERNQRAKHFLRIGTRVVAAGRPVAPERLRLVQENRPLSSFPRSFAKQLSESKRGRQSQSMDPSSPTRAAVSQSPIRAWSSIRAIRTALSKPDLLYGVPLERPSRLSLSANLCTGAPGALYAGLLQLAASLRIFKNAP